jgi:class 3 adenylate cyclase
MWCDVSRRPKNTRLVNLDTVFHGIPAKSLTLQDAACSGNYYEVKQMLMENADVNAADYDKRTALHLACCEGHENVVLLLISSSADLSVRDRWGSQPYKEAIHHGHQNVADILANAGAVLSTENRRDLELSFIQGAYQSNFQRLRTLLTGGVSINAVDDANRTALHHAASRGHLDVVRYLLACNADINRADCLGHTAAYEAENQGHVDLASVITGTTPKSMQLKTYCPTEVSVLFVDIKGFTEACATIRARAVGEWVAAFYTIVNRTATRFGVCKAEVRGDCCICVTGRLADAPCRRLRITESPSRQVTRMLAFASALHMSLSTTTGGTPTRMGLAFGEVAFILDCHDTGFMSVQGDVVNVAARMEAAARVGTVMVHGPAATRWATEAAGRTRPHCETYECKGRGLQHGATFDCERARFVAKDSLLDVVARPGIAAENCKMRKSDSMPI